MSYEAEGRRGARRPRRRFRLTWRVLALPALLVLVGWAVRWGLAARRGAEARRTGAPAVAATQPAGAGSGSAGRGSGGGSGSGTGAGLPPAAYSPQRPPRPWSGPLPYPILIADSGNDRILEVTPDKRVVWRYPGPQTGARSRGYGTSGDDAFFSPDGRYVVTNDEDRGTILRIDYATRRVTWHFGVPGRLGGGSRLLNYPDDAYLLPDGDTIVADIRNCRELTIDAAARIVRDWGRPQSGYCRTDPRRGLFGYPNGDTPQPGGDILMSFISGDRIALLSPLGRVIWETPAPDLYGGYVSDAQLMPNGDVLVAGYGKPGTLVVFNPRTRAVVWQYHVTSGPGELNHPSLALPLPGGDILLNDDRNDRVIVIDPRTDRIVWQYGVTGVPGRAPGYLNVPDGVDVDYWHDWRSFLGRGAAAGGAAAPAAAPGGAPAGARQAATGGAATTFPAPH
jgi:hypothetical protein